MNTLVVAYTERVFLHLIPGVFVCHRFTSANMGLGPSKQIQFGKTLYQKPWTNKPIISFSWKVLPSIKHKNSECFYKSSCFNKQSQFKSLKQSEYLPAHTVIYARFAFRFMRLCCVITDARAGFRFTLRWSEGYVLFICESPQSVFWRPLTPSHSILLRQLRPNEVRVHKTIAFGIHLLQTAQRECK